MINGGVLNKEVEALFLSGSIKDISADWLLIGKTIYKKNLALYGEERANEIMGELFTHVLNNKEVKESKLVFWANERTREEEQESYW